jgi:hypothetical protein
MTNCIFKPESRRSNLGHRPTGKTSVARPEKPDFCPEIPYITNRRPIVASPALINPAHNSSRTHSLLLPSSNKRSTPSACDIVGFGSCGHAYSARRSATRRFSESPADAHAPEPNHNRENLAIVFPEQLPKTKLKSFSLTILAFEYMLRHGGIVSGEVLSWETSFGP